MFRNLTKAIVMKSAFASMPMTFPKLEVSPDAAAVSDDPMALRQKLHEQTADSSHIYTQAVHGVNKALMGLGVPMKLKDYQAVSSAVDAAKAGEISPIRGHVNEVGIFLNSAVDSAAKGDFSYAVPALLGSVGNLMAACTLASTSKHSALHI